MGGCTRQNISFPVFLLVTNILQHLIFARKNTEKIRTSLDVRLFSLNEKMENK